MWKKAVFYFSMLFFVFVSFSSFSQVSTIHSVEEILPYVSEDTLIVMDLDNTIFRITQMLGCDEWFDEQIRTLQAEGFSKMEAIEQTVPLWTAFIALAKVVPIEESTQKIIAELQEKKIPVMALTLRTPSLIRPSLVQLSSLGINLAKTSPASSTSFLLKNMPEVFYRNGVLFGNGKNKGACMCAFLRQIGYFPRKIIFIDDRYPHVKNMQVVEDEGIEYYGFHYVHENQSSHYYDSNIAQKQYENFITFFSDMKLPECEGL